MDQGEAHVMSLLTIKDMANKPGKETKEQRKKRKEQEFLQLAAMHLSRYKPESLDNLEKTTKFTRREIQIMYRGFKQECPTGIVNEDTFKRVFATFFPQGDSSSYAHMVFCELDKAKHGCLTFEEFLHVLSHLIYGTEEEKLRWTFDLYDRDKDNRISRSDMEHVITAVYDLLGEDTIPMTDTFTRQRRLDELMADEVGAGGFTYEQFAGLCTRRETHPFQKFATDLRLRN